MSPAASRESAAGRRPPAERPDAGEQLREGERLGEVVVGARVQARDPVVHGAQGGEQQDGRRDALRLEQAHHGHAVDVGQAAVEDDHVVRAGLGEGDRGHAVGRHVHDVALGHEHALDQGRHLRFVFDHEDSHRGDCAADRGVWSRGRGPSVRSLTRVSVGPVGIRCRCSRHSQPPGGTSTHAHPRGAPRRVARRLRRPRRRASRCSASRPPAPPPAGRHDDHRPAAATDATAARAGHPDRHGLRDPADPDPEPDPTPSPIIIQRVVTTGGGENEDGDD